MVSSLYLLVGKEEFLKKEFIRNLKKTLFKSASDADLNFQEFDAESSGIGPFKDFLQTAPFLSEKRLAILSAIDELSEEDQQVLLAFADAWPPTAAGVLVSAENSTKKSAFLGALSEKMKTVPCYAPFDRDFPQWVAQRSKSAGIRLEGGAVNLLLERVGKDVAAISSALEALAIYAHPRTDVAERDVETLIGRSLQDDVFQLVDVLLRKDSKAALSMAASFLREGVRGPEIVGVLAGQLERLRKGRALVDAGLAPAQIGAELKVHSFFLNKFVAQAKGLGRFDFRKAFDELLACDEAMKTGALSEALAVERLALSLLSLDPVDS